MVAHSDLKVLDPIWTTAFITRNHGYLIYDTLFAKDEELRIQPQMVDKYETSPDKLTWTFTLRDGLEWHDGQPVTAEDCVASLKRWGARDALGQQLMAVGRRAEGGRRQDLHHRAQGAVRPRPRGAGQALLDRAVHDAQAGRRDRPLQADRRLYRLRSVHLQEGRMEARREDRLRQEHQVQAARRAALHAGRRQGGEDRPGRMDRHHRSADRGQCAAAGRDRPDRGAGARSLPDAQGRQEHRAVRLERARQPDHHALQPPPPAVQQSEGAAGGDVRHRPGGLPARPGGQSRDLSRVQRAPGLRLALREELRRPPDQARLRQGAAAPEGERLRRHARSS